MKLKLIAIICITAISSSAAIARDVVQDTTGVRKAVSTSPADIIKGEIAGVRVSSIDGNPNGAVNVNIRGINTVRGDSQPLWIVDGCVIGNSVNQNLDAFFVKGGVTTAGAILPDYSGRSYTSPLGNFSWLNPFEIETIEVIKDVSATALYGMQGANGVIIIKTRRSKEKGRNINWSSNVGVAFTDKESPAFKVGVNQLHTVGINGNSESGSYYNASAFFRRNESAIVNSTSSEGGLTVNFETSANKVFHFGLNSFTTYKKNTSLTGTNYVGKSSAMLMVKCPELFPKESLDGWLNDYDDVLTDFHTVNSVWFRINILPGFNFKAIGGAEYQNQDRAIWYGNKTEFGKAYNGANAILNNSLFNYNVKAELNFARNFNVKHHFEANLVFDLVGNNNMTNDMCGTDFSIKSLRYRSISSSGSQNVIRKFDRNYLEFGGYARVHYDYEGFAGLEGIFRIDRSPRFDEGVTFFPATNAFVDLKKIFLSKSNAVSTLRLEGGYGSAGKEVIMPYEYLWTYIPNVPEILMTTDYYYNGRHRVISNEWNAGISLGFLKERFTLGVKYFNKKTSDSFNVFYFGKLVSKQIVETPYYSSVQDRVSYINTKGLEADTKLGLIRTRMFRWNLGANVAWNFDRECSYDILDDFSSDLTKPADFRTIPALYGGLTTSFECIGITLEAKMSGASGYEILDMSKVLKDGRTTIQDSDFEKADYLRLDHIALSYLIPFKTKAIKACRVSLSAHNLLTISDYSGWNPDVNSYGVTARNNGIDYSSFPINRIVMAGINFTF